MSRFAVGRMIPWVSAALLGAFWLLAVWPTAAKAADGDGLFNLFDQVLNDPLDPYDNVTSFNKTYKRDGWNRKVLFMKPVVAAPEKAPLIVMLHYRGGNAKDMANLTQIGRVIRDFGAWAVLPEALLGGWKKNPAELPTIDDVGFIAAVIKDAIQNYPVDPKRVYIAGYSEGGFMTLRFACERSDLIAAGFVVAGAMLKSLADVCAPTSVLPMTFVNGTSDSSVNYNGSFGVLSAPETAMYWSSLNACVQAGPAFALPNLTDDGTTVSKLTYTQCLGTKDVDFFTINKGGHTWPGVNPHRMHLGRTSYDIDGTNTMWEFFQRYARP
jgi:polyhydroxybutyrate depolymerase